MNIKSSFNVAVLLPTFNGSLFVEKQISSILNQKDVHIKLFVYDDNSDDDTFLKASFHESVNIENINILPLFSSKKSAANSFYRIIAGIKLDPKYQFVAFADQDDIWFPNKIISAINYLRMGHYSGYSSSVLAFWKDGKTKNLKKDGINFKYNALFESAGPGCTYVITREMFDKFRSFLKLNKEVFQKIDFHDWAIYSFATQNGFNWFIDSKSRMLYRQHDSNTFGARFSLKHYLKRLHLIMEGWYFSQVYLFHKLYHPKSFLITYPKLVLFHRIYFFIMLLIHRRRIKDKLFLSLLSLIASMKMKNKIN